jgi:uncharacterized protein
LKSKKCILIFARTPQIGYGKTRLAKDLGPQLTFLIYEAAIKFLAKNLFGLPYYVIYQNENDDKLALQKLKTIFHSAKGFKVQELGDLGYKMKTASKFYFDSGYSRIILLGSDTPHVSSTEIQYAFEKLNTSNNVIGPATDGGYWLLGMKKQLTNQIFEDIDWGTNTVFIDTYKRLLTFNKSVELVAKKDDLDTLQDLIKILKEFPQLIDQDLINQIKEPF